jgi:hypothetical protein
MAHGTRPARKSSGTVNSGNRRGPTKPARSIVNQRQTPWGMIVAGILAAVLAVTITAVVIGRGQQHTPASSSGSQQIIPGSPTGATTIEHHPTVVADTSGIPGVLAWDTQGWPGDGSAHPGALEHQHVAGPVSYAVLPPVGGPHNAVWMNAGVYTTPVPNERAVHNMEHGAVWITYNPNLSGPAVAALTAFVTKQSLIPESQQTGGPANQANRYLDLSPWATDTLPTAIVLSAWGHQLRLSTPTDPRMQQFIDTFRHSAKYSPEAAEPVDGIPIQSGGRPASDGSAQRNPAGSTP